MPIALDILAALECERQWGETLYETAERVITIQALEQEGSQRAAAEFAGVSVRKINYHLETMGLRPKDRRAAQCGH